MNLVQFGKNILGLGPKGSLPQRLINLADPKNPHDAVNKRYIDSIGGGSSFNFSVMPYVEPTGDGGPPIGIDGIIYADFTGTGVGSAATIDIYTDVGSFGLVFLLCDRFSCGSPIDVTITGDTDKLSEGVPTQITIPADKSKIAIAMGFAQAGDFSLTFTATACSVTRTSIVSYLVSEKGSGSGGGVKPPGSGSGSGAVGTSGILTVYVDEAGLALPGASVYVGTDDTGFYLGDTDGVGTLNIPMPYGTYPIFVTNAIVSGSGTANIVAPSNILKITAT